MWTPFQVKHDATGTQSQGVPLSVRMVRLVALERWRSRDIDELIPDVLALLVPWTVLIRPTARRLACERDSDGPLA